MTSETSPRRLGLAAALTLLALIIPPTVRAEVIFTDVTAAAGLGNDFYLSPTGHSLGMNWIDINRDGWEDLFMVNGFDDPDDAFEDIRPHLYLNNRDGTFTNIDQFLPALPNYDQGGSKFADYDSDGDLDIFIYTDNRVANVTGANPAFGPPNLLLKNLWADNGNQWVLGQPLFEEVAAAAGVDDPNSRAKTAVWLDIDMDGCIDLHVGHWALSHDGEFSNKDRLYRNKCDGTFEDVTDTSGLYSEPNVPFSTDFRAALASVAGYFNAGDQYPDLYVVNTSTAVPGMHIPEGHIDQLFINDGDGTFTEVFFPGFGDDAQAGMGIDYADIDLDGGFDFYISDLIQHSRPGCIGCELEPAWPYGNPLYMNDGFTLSDDVAEQAGVIGASSWGVNFFDADHDMYEDLFVSVGFDSRGDPSLMYLNNQGNGTFTDITGDFTTTDARGSAACDYDRDGDIDIAVVNQRGFFQLFKNESTDQGNWIQLELRGTVGNLDAIHAMAILEVNGEVLRRQVKGGSSGHGQDSFVLHFGLAAAESVDRITIQWPGGAERSATNIPANQRLVLVEPAP